MPLKDIIPSSARNWLRGRVSITQAPQAPAAPEATNTASPINSVFGNSSSTFRSPSAYGSLKSFRVPKPKERKDAIANSRKLRAQLGIIKALFEQTARYSLGNGLVPSSLCEDVEWRPRADEYFRSVTGSKDFDIRGDSNFSQMQKTVLPDVICDGDAGAIPTRDREGNPRLQFFPSEAIGDHPGPSIFDGLGSWDEGVMRSDAGERIAYRILKDRKPGMRGEFRPYFDYDARNFFHIGRVDRINGNRPLPWLHHGDQSAINILDLNNLEMAATRLNSYFAAAIKTRTGDVPASISELLNEAEANLDEKKEEGAEETSHEEDVVAKAEKRMIDLFGEAAILPLEDGQEFQFFKHDRGTATVTEFINYLIADISVGFGVPWQFIWGMTGMAGPYARLVLQQADWFFSDVADMMVSDFCQPVWEGVIEDGLNRRLLPPPAAGTNWRAAQWQGPGSMTIDKGRDGKLYLEMVKSGMLRRSSWHEMTGKPGIDECHKTIDELADLIDYCREKEVPPEYFFGKEFAGSGLAGAMAGTAPGTSALPADELAATVVELLMDHGLILAPGKG